jgi:hypothetical protein
VKNSERLLRSAAKLGIDVFAAALVGVEGVQPVLALAALLLPTGARRKEQS